jgi:hypothetical protein
MTLVLAVQPLGFAIHRKDAAVLGQQTPKARRRHLI